MIRIRNAALMTVVLLLGAVPARARDANDAGVGYTHAHGAKPAGTALTTQYPLAIGASDGTSSQWMRLFDADTGAGTQYVLGASLRASGAGGSVEVGTAANPLRTDPTGTTTQPVSLAAVPLPAGAATAAKQDTGNASLASIDGKTVLPAALGAGGGLKVDGSGTALPVSGTFWQATQPVSLATAPLPAGAATEATLSTVNTSIGTLTTLLGVSTPAGTNTVITPNDATVLACSAVWVGTGGAVYVRGLNDAACVGFLAVPDGSLLPVRAIRVCTTGPTTATNMVCLAP